jgi:hypothetical protein
MYLGAGKKWAFVTNAVTIVSQTTLAPVAGVNTYHIIPTHHNHCHSHKYQQNQQ